MHGSMTTRDPTNDYNAYNDQAESAMDTLEGRVALIDGAIADKWRRVVARRP